MTFSRRLDDLRVSPIRRLFEIAGPDAIHLGIGEPHAQPADHVVDAYAEALRAGHNKYGPTAGLPALREAIAQRAAKADPEVGPDHVLVASGSTQVLFAAAFALLDEGDEVLVPDPGFVLYAPHTRLAGGTPVPYTLHEDRGFQPDPDEVNEAITDRTKVLIVNSPSNPTGAVLDRSVLAALVEIADDHGLYVVSDEAYDAITYGRPHETLLGASERVIYTNTFSKTYCMTGWRVGYAIAAPDVAARLRTFTYHMSACPSTPAQYAALAALEGPQQAVTQLVRELDERRRLMVDRIAAIDGLHLQEPQGAIYAFPRFDVDMPSEDVATRILEAGVVVAPGSAFGRAGEGHLRFSFSATPDDIEAGLDRVASVLAGL